MTVFRMLCVLSALVVGGNVFGESPQTKGGYTTFGTVGSDLVIYFVGDGRGVGSLGYAKLFMTDQVAKDFDIELRVTNTKYNPQHIEDISSDRRVVLAGFSNGVDSTLSKLFDDCDTVRRLSGFVAFRGKTLIAWFKAMGKSNQCNHHIDLALQICDSDVTLGCEKGFEHNVKFKSAIKGLVAADNIAYLGQGNGHLAPQSYEEMARVAKYFR